MKHAPFAFWIEHPKAAKAVWSYSQVDSMEKCDEWSVEFSYSVRERVRIPMSTQSALPLQKPAISFQTRRRELQERVYISFTSIRGPQRPVFRVFD